VNVYEYSGRYMEKTCVEGISNYGLRTEYLQALKQFMTIKPGASSVTQMNKEIDAYLGYEKRLSSQLQDALKHGATGGLHR